MNVFPRAVEPALMLRPRPSSQYLDLMSGLSDCGVCNPRYKGNAQPDSRCLISTLRLPTLQIIDIISRYVATSGHWTWFPHILGDQRWGCCDFLWHG